MGLSIWEGKKAQELLDLLEAQNHLISHQNAAIDLLASDKRASLVSDVMTVATLCKNGNILEVMDYGDQIAPAWREGENNYNPAFNLWLFDYSYFVFQDHTHASDLILEKMVD